jgi:hypothetical protein
MAPSRVKISRRRVAKAGSPVPHHWDSRIKQPTHALEEGDESAQEMYGDIEGWLILSHLAGQPFMARHKMELFWAGLIPRS